MTDERRTRTWSGMAPWSLAIAGILFAVTLFAAPALADGPSFGVRGGAYSEDDHPFFGAELRFDPGAPGVWRVDPNVEHVFMDQGGLTDLSCDFHYDFWNRSALTWYTGGGPTILYRDRNQPGESNSTNGGVNLVLGAGAKKGSTRPYGQVKVIVSQTTEAAFGLGVRF